MEVTTHLASFWHEPDGTDVRLKVRPLTQPQIMELFDTFGEDRSPTQSTWYTAGSLGMDGAGQIENLNIDGKPARWPHDREKIPFSLIVSAGVKLCMDAWGEDAGATEKN